MLLKKIKNKDNNLFYRFLFSYCIVLLIPMIIGTIVYTEIAKTVKTEAFDKNNTILKQTSETVNSYFTQIEKNVKILTMNPYLDNIAINAFHNNASIYYDKWKIIEELKTYKIMNNYVIDFLVYPEDCDFVITRISSYDKGTFYKDIFEIASMKNEVWDKYIKSNYFYGKYLQSSSMTFFGEEYETITYIESIPVVDTVNTNGAVVALIDSKFIKDMLSNIDIGCKGWVEITNKEGETILLLKGDELDSVPVSQTQNYRNSTLERNINNRKMIISKVISPNGMWTYTAYIPSEYALKNINYTKILIYIFVLLSLLVGLLTAFWFSYFNQKPLKEIIRSITMFKKKDGKTKNDFEFVKNSFNSLISDNRQLRDKIGEQLPIIKIAILDRLFKGYYSNRREIITVLSLIDLDVSGKWYGVMILKILIYEDSAVVLDVISELNLKRATINGLVTDMINHKGVTHYLDEDKIVLLSFYDQADLDKCKELAYKFANSTKDLIYENYNVEVLIGLGKLYTDVTNINNSFDEALQAVESFNLGRKVVWSTEMSKVSSIFYYPINIEAKLIHSVKQSEVLEVKKMLKDLYYENFFRRKLSPEMGWLFIGELAGTVVKIISSDDTQHEINEMLIMLKSKYSLDTAYEKVIQVFEVTCDSIKKEKKDRRKQLIDSIINYIDNNFTDPSLSLSSICELYNIGEPNLSILFKDATGKTFSAYLEQKRIGSACDIINSEINSQIIEIAIKVGYTNDTTFRRAFKRVIGLNPTEYRKDNIY